MVCSFGWRPASQKCIVLIDAVSAIKHSIASIGIVVVVSSIKKRQP